jgi:hypothetical protein
MTENENTDSGQSDEGGEQDLFETQEVELPPTVGEIPSSGLRDDILASVVDSEAYATFVEWDDPEYSFTLTDPREEPRTVVGDDGHTDETKRYAVWPIPVRHPNWTAEAKTAITEGEVTWFAVPFYEHYNHTDRTSGIANLSYDFEGGEINVAVNDGQPGRKH